MDLQADIDWIRQELKDVKDPDLIEAFKGMLRFRKKRKISSLEDYNSDIESSLKDIQQGRIYNHSDVKSMRKEWSKSI